MADVFLSYSSKDRPTAERVEQALTAAGVNVFWDQEVPVGQDWDAWLRGKLHGARVAVVLWSKASIASPNVRHEAMIARDAGKLIPTMIEPLTPEDFPMGLYLLQTIALQDWRNAGSPGVARLVAEVQSRLGQKVVNRPPPGAGKKSPIVPLIAAGVLVVAVAVAGWWYMKQRSPAAAASPGSVVTMPAAAPVTSKETFATRMLGHWRFNDKQACKDGPVITREGDRLVFITPDSRFVHIFESDAALETRTRVIEPEASLGEQYILTPEFFATSDKRSFNLVVQNITAGTKDTWTPCELTP